MCNCDIAKAPVPGNDRPVKAHKHAEVIKAWADGAEIESKPSNGMKWSFVGNPHWHANYSYRVKPTPVPLWQIAKTSFFAAHANSNWHAAVDAVIKAYEERGRVA